MNIFMTARILTVNCILLALFILLAATPAPAGEEAVVLTLRPERLNSAQANGAGASSSLRDPFNWPADQLAKPETVKVEEVDVFAGLALEGIIWNTEQPLAIINGKLVGKGDKVEGVTVKEVLKESVAVASENKSHTLRLMPPMEELKSEE